MNKPLSENFGSSFNRSSTSAASEKKSENSNLLLHSLILLPQVKKKSLRITRFVSDLLVHGANPSIQYGNFTNFRNLPFPRLSNGKTAIHIACSEIHLAPLAVLMLTRSSKTGL